MKKWLKCLKKGVNMEGKEINEKLKKEIHNLKVIIANDGIEANNNCFWRNS